MFEDLNIDVEYPLYRTRDGKKARVYSVGDGEQPYTVHGGVFSGEGGIRRHGQSRARSQLFPWSTASISLVSGKKFL